MLAALVPSTPHHPSPTPVSVCGSRFLITDASSARNPSPEPDSAFNGLPRFPPPPLFFSRVGCGCWTKGALGTMADELRRPTKPTGGRTYQSRCGAAQPTLDGPSAIHCSHWCPPHLYQPAAPLAAFGALFLIMEFSRSGFDSRACGTAQSINFHTGRGRLLAMTYSLLHLVRRTGRTSYRTLPIYNQNMSQAVPSFPSTQ